jgi:hypothetical protein
MSNNKYKYKKEEINKLNLNLNMNENINNYSNHNNNESQEIDNESNSYRNEKIINYLDNELKQKKPNYKKKLKKESISLVNPNQKKNNNNNNNNNNIILSKKIKVNKESINPKKKPPLKVLTFSKNEFNKNINKRSNSSGASRNRVNNSNNNSKFGGVRLYEQYMYKLNKKKQINGIEEEEKDKEVVFRPAINKNSRRIVERMRNNEENKVEERLINDGYNKRQKHLIQHAVNEIRNKTKSPFRPKINARSRYIANKNKKIE